MKLTNPEKLILNMLANLNEKCGIDTEQAKLVNRAIVTGNTWALSVAPEFGHINGDTPEPLPKNVEFVYEVLGMWNILEHSIAQLTQEQRDELNKGYRLAFDGFDGNNETELMGIVQFITGDLKKFQGFHGRYVNSHAPRRDDYLDMLRVYKPIYKAAHDSTLGFDDLKTILSA